MTVSVKIDYSGKKSLKINKDDFLIFVIVRRSQKPSFKHGCRMSFQKGLVTLNVLPIFSLTLGCILLLELIII